MDTCIKVVTGNCFEKIGEIEKNSVHLVITDPPYFLDGLDSAWRKGGENAKRATGVVGGLPVGMKFDPKQGRALQDFIGRIGELLLGVMLPGAFAVMFSQPRLAHRMAVGMEEAGFEIRDLLVWHFTRRAQFKAFSQEHFVNKMDIPIDEKEALKRDMQGRKTPQLRPQFEAMILAQKPREGTFVENWKKYKTGLIDPKKTLDGNTPNTVMTVEKPHKEQYNGHLTVKPLHLITHLIELLSLPRQTVLDPFLGSGTTALAAWNTGRCCVGIESNPDYIEIAKRRLAANKYK